MNNKQDDIANLIKFMLVNIKNMQIRMEIANAYIKFKGNDKHRLNSVVNRLKAGIEDIINLHPDPKVKKAVMEDLDDKSDDMIARVYFIDQALRIPEEHLEPIADIINDYLNLHYPPKDEEEQM